MKRGGLARRHWISLCLFIILKIKAVFELLRKSVNLISMNRFSINLVDKNYIIHEYKM